MSLDNFLNKKLGLAPEKEKVEDKKQKGYVNGTPRVSTKQISEKKEILTKYIFALNRGHKTYENYGFKDNHAFLAEIMKLLNEI